MQTIEYRTTDKAAWPRGPWDDEPDKMQWQDEATGLPCLAVRGPGGHWCGYVGVAEGHPWYDKGYNDCVRPENHEDHEGGEDGWHYSCTPCGMVRVHGGLTFADACRPDPDETADICHKPEPGEPDHVWWFGFDCAHLDDLSPGYERRFFRAGVYRNLGYVQSECADLAKQLAGLSLQEKAA